MSANYQVYGGLSTGKKTQTAGTVIAKPVWPMALERPGPGVGVKAKGFSHVTSLIYNIGTTLHTLTVMRPLNYAYFAADAAASQATVVLAADPGVYSGGGYKYGLPNGATAPRTANNTIAANDYVVYKCADGTWVLDTVASGSYSALVLTTNLPTGGVKSGDLLYFFGITTDADPATGEAHPQFKVEPAGSGTADKSYYDANGLWCTLHEGDPMIFHSSNGTADGIFNLIAGFYASR